MSSPNCRPSFKRKVCNLSDSGDDDDSDGPSNHKISKMMPLRGSFQSSSGVSTMRASSQSSSGADYNSASDDHSQPESDGEAPPSFSNLHGASSSSSIEPPKHRFKVGGIGERILKNAGYEEGTGLGKYNQGRVEPIEAFNQRGRTGLGFQSYSKGKKYDGPDFDPSMENVSVDEEVHWMEPAPQSRLDRDILERWMKLGPKKMTIDDELEYCDEDMMADILSLKTAFDEMTAEDLRRVRSLCNPFEKIGSAFFINRAALKMANMDAVFDFMFTNPRDSKGAPMVGHNDLLYFADVCAGPGGFTEYVLWKKNWKVKGFGFTLKCKNDFKLGDLHACSTETFFPYYGVNNDGDIFNPANLESLKKFVLMNTEDKGVHFMMADGGFSVEGQENIQEILSKQLYLCQCVAALSIVRTGGHFVVKLFDIFTSFSVGLIYLMYRSFDKISIHKPNTSRPANSERYLICKGKRENCDEIERHLLHVNTILWRNEKKNEDVTELVPLKVIRKDSKFYNYIRDSNNRIGHVQKVNLLKVISYHADPTKFEETRHSEIRAQCLKRWNIPDEPKNAKYPCSAPETLKMLLARINSIPNMRFEERSLVDSLKFAPREYNPSNKEIETDLKYKLDWKFVFLNNDSEDKIKNNFNFYLGSNCRTVYKLVNNRWQVDEEIRLPAKTLVLAERVQENSGEGSGMRRLSGLHIIDAIMLGGMCVLHKNLLARYHEIALFCKAHNIPQMINVERNVPLRCKKLYDLKDLPEEISNLVMRKVKSCGFVNTTRVPNLEDNSDLYFVTRAILLLKLVKYPWVTEFSKSHQCPYYFNLTDRNTSYKFEDVPSCNVFDGLKKFIELRNIHEEHACNKHIKTLFYVADNRR